jgi:hypothetical protein
MIFLRDPAREWRVVGMKRSASTSLPLLFLALTLGFPRSDAAEAATAEDAPLIVTAGKFTHDGKTEPATLKNLVDFIHQRYPRANVTLVDVEDLIVDHLRLQWRGRPDRDDSGQRVMSPPPLNGVLTALAEASGRRFEIQSFSNQDFVLRAWQTAAGPLATRIFNLKALIAPSARTRDLEDELQMVQTQLKGMLPRVSIGAMSKEDLAPLENRVAIIRRRLDEIPKPEAELERLLAQIREVVDMTLKLSHPSEGVPEFKYHPGSGLLISVGSEAAVDTTRMVIEALGKKG